MKSGLLLKIEYDEKEIARFSFYPKLLESWILKGSSMVYKAFGALLALMLSKTMAGPNPARFGEIWMWEVSQFCRSGKTFVFVSKFSSSKIPWKFLGSSTKSGLL